MLSSEEPFLAECNGWVVGANVLNWYWLLLDGDYLDGLVARLPRGTILFFLMEGTSDTYCLGVARDGQVLRNVTRSQGEIVVDFSADAADDLGFSAESLAESDDPEDYVFAILTSMLAPFEELEALTFTSFAPTDPS